MKEMTVRIAKALSHRLGKELCLADSKSTCSSFIYFEVSQCHPLPYDEQIILRPEYTELPVTGRGFDKGRHPDGTVRRTDCRQQRFADAMNTIVSSEVIQEQRCGSPCPKAQIPGPFLGDG